MTAHALEIAEKESLQAGMNTVLTKPIRLNEITNVLNEFLPNSQSTLIQSSDNPNTAKTTLEEAALFELEKYPLLDVENGISLLGSASALKELLLIMINDSIPEDHKYLLQAYSKKDWEQVAKLAHKMKGGAMYCGTIRLQIACLNLEKHRSKGYAHIHDALFKQLNTVIDLTKEAIRNWIKT